jgi:hypothetical protein
VDQVKDFSRPRLQIHNVTVGWGGIFFRGRFSGLASSFVSEKQLRVHRGWNEMTAAYLGNHVSPRGGGSSNADGIKFTGDICRWFYMEEQNEEM